MIKASYYYDFYDNDGVTFKMRLRLPHVTNAGQAVDWAAMQAKLARKSGLDTPQMVVRGMNAVNGLEFFTYDVRDTERCKWDVSAYIIK